MFLRRLTRNFHAPLPIVIVTSIVFLFLQRQVSSVEAMCFSLGFMLVTFGLLSVLYALKDSHQYRQDINLYLDGLALQDKLRTLLKRYRPRSGAAFIGNFGAYHGAQIRKVIEDIDAFHPPQNRLGFQLITFLAGAALFALPFFLR